ncbi:MAG: DUF434 domain-containing protein [Thermodesulfobacteriota bacterium]
MLKSRDLQKAAQDFRYLLNHGYSRKASLELVGNRYQLNSDQRHLLHRGVYSDADSASRHKRRLSVRKVRGKELAIDGYNVIITIEAGLARRLLILGDDGFIRDISGLSGSYRRTERTEAALRLILDALKKLKPSQTLFLFDAPISMSGAMAREVRALLKKENLPGDAKAVKVPEKILTGYPGVVATSDTAVIDQSKNVLDLAGHILMQRNKLASFIQWNVRRGRSSRDFLQDT